MLRLHIALVVCITTSALHFVRALHRIVCVRQHILECGPLQVARKKKANANDEEKGNEK